MGHALDRLLDRNVHNTGGLRTEEQPNASDRFTDASETVEVSDEQRLTERTQS